MAENTTIEGTTGWTVETLKEWVDQRFADNQTAVSAALLAAKEAVIKQEVTTEKKFDAVTKSVTELADQSGDLLPRTEYIANHKALDDKIVVVTDAINRSSGDKNLYATNTYVTQLVSQSITNLETKLEVILKPLVDHVSLQKGEALGSQMTVGRFYGAIAAVGTILGIIIVIASFLNK